MITLEVYSMFECLTRHCNISADGDCYPVYPLNCHAPLDDTTAYYQHIYVPEEAVVSTLSALGAAGHKCSVSHDWKLKQLATHFLSIISFFANMENMC